MREDDVSMVLPCYNEENTLEGTVTKAKNELEKHSKDFEIIIVEDGCTDSTPEIASNLTSELECMKHLHFEERLGKGKAVEKGFESAEKSKLFFMDTDLATDLNHISKLIEELDENDLVIGSRYIDGSEAERGLIRDLLSKGYNSLARLSFGTGISDHQCGFKGINRDAYNDIKDSINSDHWFWDTELLVQAEENNYSTKEIPVEWEEKEGSEVSVKNSIVYFSKKILGEKIGQ